MAASLSTPRLQFINETGSDGYTPRALSPVKRQTVRSQAMIAVRRKQREEAERHLRLRWTNPKLACKDENGVESETSPVGVDDKKQTHLVGRYKFVETTQSVTLRSAGSEGTRDKSKRPRSEKDGSRIAVEGTQSPTHQAISVGSWGVPPVPDYIERFGGGRRSPFETYPIPFSDEVNELVDHYTVVIPYLMYGTTCKNPMQRLLYYLSFNDLAALCAIMAQASRHIDALHGTSYSPRSLRHVSATMKAVNDSLQNGDSTYTEATIFAVGQLAITERRFGSKSVSKQHWMGLKRILEQRGGLQSINQNRQLGAMLIWNDLVFARDQLGAGVETDDWPTLLDDYPRDPQDEEQHQSILEFCHQLEIASRKAKQREHETGYLFRLWKQRLRLFTQGSILYNTLFGEPEVKDHQRRLTSLACQNSCLTYFGVAFLDYTDKPEQEQPFLRALEDMTQTELCWGVSPEHLIARLVMGLIAEDAATASFRARRVMRLMLEVKDLDSDACARVRDQLWKSVSLSC